MSETSTTQITAEPGEEGYVVTRDFDAPPDLVFQACTDPDLIPEWWGPKYLTTTVDRFEPRQGGVWRLVQHDPNGNEYAFHGVYHEVLRPERVVQTFEFEGMPGHVLMETTRFEDLGGKTRLTTISVFQTVEDRDGMLRSGMEQGMTESHDRLAELLKKLQQEQRGG